MKRYGLRLVCVLCCLLAAGCAVQNGYETTPSRSENSAQATGPEGMEMAGGNGPAGSPDADETSAPAQETKPPAASGGTGQEDAVTLTITIDGIEAKLLLEKNAAASALAKRLREGAVTYTANDFGGFEKVGEPLEFSLPRADTYIEAQPGDAVLYQGNRIVLFYGGNGWSYTRIGRLEGLSLSELADFLRAGKGAVRVTLSLDGSGCTE